MTCNATIQNYIKRAACIHDLSGLGKCSLTVALPILSAMGHEACAIPTAVLSTHTGGIAGFTYHDLTDDIVPIANHWASLGLTFDAIYTGFASSARQIGLIRDIIPSLATSETIVFVDPVMADHGRLYKTYTQEMALETRRLCGLADIITPNMTEAAILTGSDYLSGVQPERVYLELCKRLSEVNHGRVMLTGVSTREGRVGVASYEDGVVSFAERPYIEGDWHGTGDIIASVSLGSVLRGASLREASEGAVAFTHAAIEATSEAKVDPRFGVLFERELVGLGVR